jgi:hypothetical protein
MNTYRATEFIDTKSKTTKVTTTLYDLLTKFNSNYLGPQWELAGQEPVDDGRLASATKKVDRMFRSGRIRFENPPTIKKYFNDIIR